MFPCIHCGRSVTQSGMTGRWFHVETNRVECDKPIASPSWTIGEMMAYEAEQKRVDL